MKKHILTGALFALVLLASVVRASETVEQTDLADMFQGFDGTFVMYDEGAGRYTVFNKARSETRFSPCSTFKVFHALIGLDSGVLERDDARTLMKWNGKPSSIAAWNHDQTLASAIRHSVVWYFQRVAAGIGEERMRAGAGSHRLRQPRHFRGADPVLASVLAQDFPARTSRPPARPLQRFPALRRRGHRRRQAGTSRCPPRTACASWARQDQAPDGAGGAPSLVRRRRGNPT